MCHPPAGGMASGTMLTGIAPFPASVLSTSCFVSSNGPIYIVIALFVMLTPGALLLSHQIFMPSKDTHSTDSSSWMSISTLNNTLLVVAMEIR